MMRQTVDILLVEDDINDAELAIRALHRRQVGQHVLHALDGDKALDYIYTTSLFGNWEGSDPPKLVILDLKLKNVSGIELLKTLKTSDHTKTIPVVVFTASRDEIERVESYRFGVNSYVLKPSDYNAYAELVGDIGHYWVNINQSPDIHALSDWEDPAQPTLAFVEALEQRRKQNLRKDLQ